MPKGPTWAQIGEASRGERQDVVTRQASYRDHSNDHGASTYLIKCPFCEDEIEAYKWSLAGGGKRCHCGAMHGGLSGDAYQFAHNLNS